MDKKYITTVLLELCVVFILIMLQEKQKKMPPSPGQLPECLNDTERIYCGHLSSVLLLAV
jgi:hypothetical protein